MMKEPHGRKGRTLVSIYDVAKFAKVSTATVSAVINNRDTVEAGTRRRVLAAIKKLHYQPNLYASNLARRTTRLFGLIVSDIVNPFFGEVAQAIRAEAQAQGYEVSLAATQFAPADLVAIIRRLIGMRVAGVAIISTEIDPRALEILRESRTPAVFEDVGTVSETVSNIRIDYEGGIFKAVKYLVDLGHRKLLYVRGFPDGHRKEQAFLSIRLRTEAFRAAIRRFRLQGVQAEITTYPGPGPCSGQQALHKARKQFDFTAAVAMSDPVALGVLRGLRECGLGVPREVSLIGFDNSYFCEYLSPPLTSVNIPRARLAQMVVDCLVRNVEYAAPGQELFLETELIVRESTAPPANPPAARRSASGHGQ